MLMLKGAVMTSFSKDTSKPSTPRSGKGRRLPPRAIKAGEIKDALIDPVDLDYVVIYQASAQDRIEIVKGGITASIAKRIVADLDMPAALTYEALRVPISTINR